MVLQLWGRNSEFLGAITLSKEAALKLDHANVTAEWKDGDNNWIGTKEAQFEMTHQKLV